MLFPIYIFDLLTALIAVCALGTLSPDAGLFLQTAAGQQKLATMISVPDSARIRQTPDKADINDSQIKMTTTETTAIKEQLYSSARKSADRVRQPPKIEDKETKNYITLSFQIKLKQFKAHSAAARQNV